MGINREPYFVMAERRSEFLMRMKNLLLHPLKNSELVGPLLCSALHKFVVIPYSTKTSLLNILFLNGC
jgi:hypothetical protein